MKLVGIEERGAGHRERYLLVFFARHLVIHHPSHHSPLVTHHHPPPNLHNLSEITYSQLELTTPLKSSLESSRIPIYFSTPIVISSTSPPAASKLSKDGRTIDRQKHFT